MKLLLLLISFTIVCSFTAFAAESYTLYLVRHAEKQKEADNPHLTQCGKFRAKQLADLLKYAKLNAIYSTSYNRTLETAGPTAKEYSLGIKQYSPRGLNQLAHMLKQNRQNALIVGHSNTTSALTTLLIDEDVEKISEHEFNHLYQIHVSEKKATLIKLIQPLVCNH